MKEVKLKKDWPPFPKGTIFKIKKGLIDEMLCSPTFGEIMPNGEKANGMIPRTWTEYIRHFDHVGGFAAWFEIYDEKIEHLIFIYNLLLNKGVEENVDFMVKFKEIINELSKPK